MSKIIPKSFEEKKLIYLIRLFVDSKSYKIWRWLAFTTFTKVTEKDTQIDNDQL